MNSDVKKIVMIVCILGAVVLTGYVAYQGYLYFIEDATARIKKGVSEGVGEGIGGAANPLKWFSK